MTDKYVPVYNDRITAKSLIRDFVFSASLHGESLHSITRMDREERNRFLGQVLKFEGNELQCVEDFLMGFAKAANLSAAWILGMEMADGLRAGREERA